MVASEAAKNFAHSITWGVTLAILTNLTQYTYTVQSKKTWKTSHWQKYGPVYFVGLSVPLVMADLTRHVLQDSHFWNASMYRPGCDQDDFKCLSVIGWLFTVCFTYLGFLSLFIGVLWR